MQNEIKLTTGQVNELARLASGGGDPLPRSSNRAKALERLRKLLAQKLNDSDAFFNSLSQIDPQDETAFEAVRADLAEDTGQDAPVPLVKPAATERQSVAGSEGSPTDGDAPSVARKARSSGAGKKSRYAGMLLYPLRHNPDGTPINPRRVGSFGHTSLGIICTEPGVTYEEFIARGGRARDLDWDIKFEHAKAEPKAAQSAASEGEAS